MYLNNKDISGFIPAFDVCVFVLRYKCFCKSI